MSDLIRRTDAIKAVEDLPNAYNGWSDAYDKACIIGTLEEVPSAKVIDAEALKQELSKAPVWTTLSVMEMIDEIERSRQ